MSTTAIVTVVSMMESLPESTQTQVVDHLREFLADLEEDEAQWDAKFTQTESALVETAKLARQQHRGE